MGSITVRAGDSMSAIAARNAVSLRELEAANPQVENPNLIFPGQELELPGARDDFAGEPTAAPVATPPPPPLPPAPESGAGDVTVARGDTLWAIASRAGVSLPALVAANPHLADPNVIHPGDVVHLPGATGETTPMEPSTPTPATEGSADEYTVRTGDSLSGIAARAGVSLAALLRANPDIRNPNLLYPGQRVQVPAGADVPAPRVPVTPSPTGAPGANPYFSEFVQAAHIAGVPESWASNPSMLQLVKHESGFDPAAKNPTSSALGLFQFLDSTWKSYLPEVPYGSKDPTWQAVGGMRYISQRYGTPERAWAFWQSTVNRDPSIAPADLRGLSQYWVDHRYAGY